MKNQKGVSLITLIITIIVVIILAVIVLRSGASDAPEQAAFSGFTQEMGELQNAVNLAMLEAKSSEILKGNIRTEAQLYNFIARGGYKAFDNDKNISGDAKWLLQAHEKNYQCVPINREHAKSSIGIELPDRKVETDYSVATAVEYFLTPEGIVFCWPPYVYDGKSYVNANTTVKRGVDFDFAKNEIVKNEITELKETEATKMYVEGNYYYDVIILFENGEFVMVNNNPSTTGEENNLFLNDTYGFYNNRSQKLNITNWSGKIDGLDFERYENNKIVTLGGLDEEM